MRTGANMGQWLELATADGDMAVYQAIPGDTGAANGRTAVVLMEAFGLTRHIQDLCDRFADAGWRALAPDLYHRTAPRQSFDERHIDDAMQHYRSVTAETVLADWDALADQLSTPTVITGLCMGGRWAFVVACERSAQLTAASSFYGAGIERELERCDRLNVPLQLIYGEHDPLISAEARLDTDAALTAAGARHTMSVFPAGHGFMCPQRSSYAPTEAAAAWAGLLAFFDGESR